MEKSSRRVIAISGYGWSGSSAMVDLLKEFDGYEDMGTEFRLIKDPYGIISLESSLVDNWDILTCDIAIKDFVWFARKLNKVSYKFSHFGMSYEKLIGKEFMKLTLDYVESLKTLEYKGDWFFFDMNLNRYQYFTKRVKRKLGFNFEKHTMCLSKPEREVFIKKTKKYVNEIVNAISLKNNGVKNIILDQAIPLPKPLKAMNYFENVKMIIVDRDPRDIYIDLINRKAFIGDDLSRGGNVEKYIEWHRALHEPLEELNDPRILRVKFEDLVYKYEDTLKVITSFLGEENGNHVNKKKFFKPSISSENIGLYKKYKKQDEIIEIYNSLKEYTYKLD